jgi:hypothetical protein
MLLRLPHQPLPVFFIKSFEKINYRVQNRLGWQQNEPDEKTPESYFYQRGDYRQNYQN